MGRKSQNFCLTVFDTTVDQFKSIIDPITIHAVYQLEKCPTTGRLHIQAYIKTIEKYNFTELKLLLPESTHVEATKSPKAAIKYCSKPESRVDGPFTKGISTKESKYNLLRERVRARDLQTIVNDDYGLYLRHRRAILDEIAMQNTPQAFDHTRGIWLWGKSGTGKTQFVNNFKPFWKPLNKWWDGYDAQRYCLFDDIDADIWKWAVNYIKLWTDHYPVRGEIKGGFIHLVYEWFIITSNISLDDAISSIGINHRDAIKRRFKCFSTDSESWQFELTQLIS